MLYYTLTDRFNATLCLWSTGQNKNLTPTNFNLKKSSDFQLIIFKTPPKTFFCVRLRRTLLRFNGKLEFPMFYKNISFFFQTEYNSYRLGGKNLTETFSASRHRPRHAVLSRRLVVCEVPIRGIIVVHCNEYFCFIGENVLLKSKSNPEKSTGVDRGMTVVFVFLGVVVGMLILMSIIIVSYCIYRRRNIIKHMNDGTYTRVSD